MNGPNMQREILDVQCHQIRALWFYLVKVAFILYQTQYPVYITLILASCCHHKTALFLWQNSLGTADKLAHTNLLHVSLTGSVWY